MRILHITQSAGGVETYILQTLSHLDRTRFEPHLICPENVGSLAEKAEALGIPVYPLDVPREISVVADLRAVIETRRQIKWLNPDLIHAHSSKGGVLGRLAALRTGIPVIYTPNAYAFLGASRFNGKIYQLVERVLRHTTACLLAVGESERTRSINDVGFPESKVALVNNAISLPAVSNMEEDITEPMVLMVGRLCYQKNPEMFVRAAGRVHRRHPECRFELIGGGYHEHHGRTVRGLIDELDLQDRFEIHDWMTPQGVADRITQATIMVVPSRYDGLPFIPLEAMALGKPVVGTRVDGVQDVIVDGETGFLVDLDDDEAMAGKILRLLDDPELRERMGQAGRKRVGEHFNIVKNIQKIEAVYDDVYEQYYGQSPSV